MIVESLIIGGTIAAYKNWDKLMIRYKWGKITGSKSKFTNLLDKTLQVQEIVRTSYGFDLQVELPYGYTVEEFEKDMNIFKEGLKFDSIQFESKGNVVILHCIKDYEFKEYTPLKLPPNKLLIADGLTGPLIVDMNKFPHCLIGGDTGTGKSRILLMLLTNLIKYSYSSSLQLYLLQVRKNDLGVFENCEQVKCFSRTLPEVLKALVEINIECEKREKLIDNKIGYYNIEDYNKNNEKKLSYIYAVIDEFSFLNPDKGDDKITKSIKSQCMMYIKSIVNAGRSSGVFLITSLQKPTSDSIPSNIKAMLCTRISLKIQDSPTSVVILGNGNATDLHEREVILRTLGEEKGYSFTIDHDMIMNHISEKNTIVYDGKGILLNEPIYSVNKESEDEGINKILEVLNEINKAR